LGEILYTLQYPNFQIPTYQLRSSGTSGDDNNLSFVSDVIRACSSKELDLFQPKGKWISGNYFHTIMVDTEKYLPYALKSFVKQGGLLQEGFVQNFRELKKRLREKIYKL
jgi:hypothetical protein